MEADGRRVLIREMPSRVMGHVEGLEYDFDRRQQS